MGLLSKIFSKEKKSQSPRGFHELTVSRVRYLCGDTIEITFALPVELRSDFFFEPGQYVNVSVELNGEELRRSYSIASAPGNDLVIAVKKVESGLVSNHLFDSIHEGDTLLISKPEGNFGISSSAKNVVAFAAGSGITPILSIASSYHSKGTFRLFYGNKDRESILFKEELESLQHVSKTYLLSREQIEGYDHGRIDKAYLSQLIKNDLSHLKADAYLICGPEEMIVAVKESLNLFGVSDDKIIYELFSSPLLLLPKNPEPTSDFKGSVELTIQLDGDIEEITINEKTTILDAAMKAGIDAPYSCRGGVCSSCKCKIIEGTAIMRMNYVLTDKDIEDGILLSCQATPTSSVLKVSYDI